MLFDFAGSEQTRPLGEKLAWAGLSSSSLLFCSCQQLLLTSKRAPSRVGKPNNEPVFLFPERPHSFACPRCADAPGLVICTMLPGPGSHLSGGEESPRGRDTARGLRVPVAARGSQCLRHHVHAEVPRLRMEEQAGSLPVVFISDGAMPARLQNPRTTVLSAG